MMDVMDLHTPGPLVDAGWLRDHADCPGLVVADCRFRLGEPGAGLARYLEGHIPGAAYLDLDADLAGAPGERGRHPLPEPERFQASARRAGISARSTVVAYDEAGEGGAARLWWLLRHHGHDAVAVLDGGLAAWRDAGLALRSGHEHHTQGDLTARARAEDTVDARGAAAATVLLDARAAERFRGEKEPVDPVAGHIPGAVNLPFAELAPGGRFLDAPALRLRLESAGVVPGAEVAAYCGSGVTACTIVLAAEVAGMDRVRLYPGSWSEWSLSGRPAER
jgi:thiosulfate/3-mercaptopyruvate sulfurtransferase